MLWDETSLVQVEDEFIVLAEMKGKIRIVIWFDWMTLVWCDYSAFGCLRLYLKSVSIMAGRYLRSRDCSSQSRSFARGQQKRAS